MKLMIFGATGMVGQAALHACLNDPEVSNVLTIGRSSTNQTHAKLRDVVVPDVMDLTAIEQDLEGYDGCLFCLGVSSVGMAEEEYTRLTYHLTLSVAGTVARLNPEMTFVYVSGMGTDSSERGRSMWARVKGRTENALLRLPFRAAYMFRPALIIPQHGATSKTRWTRLGYTVTRPLHGVLSAALPGYVATSDQLGSAMIEVVRNGFGQPILETRDIRKVGDEAMNRRTSGAAGATR